jgi:ribulose-phosphate 3-epimerase
VHLDVMDNHIRSPNLTFGPSMIAAIGRGTDLPMDAHLMITDVDRLAPAYVEAGAASVTFHVEGGRGTGPARARDQGPRRARQHGAQGRRPRSSRTRTCSRSWT